MYVFKVVKNSQTKIFIMNNHRLFCLEDGTSIHMDKQHSSSDSQMMFGQAEILLTRDRRLIISREGKINPLKGNIEDGIWYIDSYL